MSTECKLAKLALNFDMSGMVQPCHLTDYFLKDKDGRHFNVLTDDVKDIWNSEHRKKLLDDHANGIKNPTCKLCWDMEETGVESMRQSQNNRLKDVEVLEQPRVMVVKPGNLCNNACRSCNAHTSSMWYKDDHAMNHENTSFKEYLKFFQRHKTAYTNNQLLENRFAKWEDKIIEWDMFGGEPLIVPLFYKILNQSCTSENAHTKKFNVHTNGMIYSEGLIKKLSKFRESHMGFSIDAIGEKNDYIRHGSKWDNIINNLKRYVEDCAEYPNVLITVRTTITPWNIYHYDENFEYFSKMGILAIGCWCNDKPWNDLRYLPENVKKNVLDKLLLYKNNRDEWQELLVDLTKWMMSRPADYNKLKNSFMEFNKTLDELRGQKFESVFPEYSKLFT